MDILTWFGIAILVIVVVWVLFVIGVSILIAYLDVKWIDKQNQKNIGVYEDE